MIGRRLTELRKKQKLSQEKVAKQIGIPRSTYSNYEAGNREPDHEMTHRLADFYGVTIDFLLGKTDDPTITLSEDAITIINLLDLTDDEIIKRNINLVIDDRKLSDEEILRFIAYVRTERQLKGLK